MHANSPMHTGVTMDETTANSSTGPVRHMMTRIRRGPRITLRPASLDEAAGTLECVAASETPIQLFGTRPDGSFGRWREVLDIASLDLTRSPVPVQIDHSRSALANIGLATLRREGRKLIGDVQTTRRSAAAAVVEGVAEGTMCQWSISYRPGSYALEKADSENPVFRCLNASVIELSLVGVGADPSSRSRSMEYEEMDEQVETAGRKDAVPPVINRAEQRRIADIRRRAVGAMRVMPDLPAQAIEDAIADGISGDEFTERMFAEMAQRSDQQVTTRTVVRVEGGADHTDPAALIERMATAYHQRAAVRGPTDDTRDFYGMSLLSLGCELAQARGLRVPRGMSPSQQFDFLYRQLGTSDYPALTEAVVNKMVLAGWGTLQPALLSVSRPVPVSDFKAHNFIRLGAAANGASLPEVPEHGEVTNHALEESKESVRAKTYALIISLSRQLQINDDAGGLLQLALIQARQASNTVAGLLWAVLYANAGAGQTLATDSTPIFHANHANLAGSGAAPDVTTLGAGRAAMRTQKDLDKSTPLNLTPKFILTGAALETAVQSLLAPLQPTTLSEQNPFAGSSITQLVEPRISGNAWWLFADPGIAPVVTHCWLNGIEGPQIVAEEGFRTFGTEYRVHIDFGAAAIDYRGGYRNAGA